MFKCFKKPTGKQSFTIPDIIPTLGSFSPFELDVMELINYHRQEKGLNKLSLLHFRLLDIARNHSEFMAEVGKAGHQNFPIRNAQVNKHLKASWLGECVAYGYGTAAGVVNSWIKSEGHRKILESTKARSMALSIVTKKGRNYFTLLLINK